MAWRRIAAGGHRAMPWKNGGGSTAEIAIGPQGASVADAFDWRLSIATVAQDGPFSAFPGYDRLITLLAGRGMELRFDGAGRHTLEVPFRPLPFAGECRTECRLIDGACEDLNLMVARDRLAYRYDVLRPGAPWRLGARGALRLLFLFRGSARLDVTALGPRDTVVVDPPDDPPPIEPGPDALALLMLLSPAGQAAER